MKRVLSGGLLVLMVMLGCAGIVEAQYTGVGAKLEPSDHAAALETARLEYEARMAEAEWQKAYVERQLEVALVALETGRVTDPEMKAAFAGIPVIDVANLAEQILHYIQRLFEVYQKAEQLANDAIKLYNQARNLLSLAQDIRFRSNDLAVAEFLINQSVRLAGPFGASSLGNYSGLVYSSGDNLIDEIRATLRGFQALPDSIDVRRLEHGDVVLRNPRDAKVFVTERIAEGMKKTLLGVRDFEGQFVESQLELKVIKDGMRNQDEGGAVQAIEDLAAIAAHNGEQTSLVIGMQALQVGAMATLEATRANAELEALATGEKMVAVGQEMLSREYGTHLPQHLGATDRASTGLPQWY